MYAISIRLEAICCLASSQVLEWLYIWYRFPVIGQERLCNALCLRGHQFWGTVHSC